MYSKARAESGVLNKFSQRDATRKREARGERWGGKKKRESGKITTSCKRVYWRRNRYSTRNVCSVAQLTRNIHFSQPFHDQFQCKIIPESLVSYLITEFYDIITIIFSKVKIGIGKGGKKKKKKKRAKNPIKVIRCITKS